MSKYIPTIGIEIHAELKTRTKMFCGCLNDPDEKLPNKNACPICLAHPGTLPVINEDAVKKVIQIGMALNGDIPQITKFDRKNYFYPDLPKGYQISQYDLPLVFGGTLKGVKLIRIHLEEDTGKLQHSKDGKHSLVDFNRAGVPLMELVTEPDIKDANQAIEFAKELQLILRYLGASYANMEKGQMRVEANVSLGTLEDGEPKLGTKVELKNLNSFKVVNESVQYEIKRQEKILESGKKVVQETRGWDEKKRETFSQRIKEEAHDYRYFPEPDLPPIDMTKFDLTGIKRGIPELPQAKRVRFVKEYGITKNQAEALVQNEKMAQFFEESISELKAEDKENVSCETNLLFNYLDSDLRGLMVESGVDFENLRVTPENFADLIELISHNKITSRVAKDLLRKMQESGADPHIILREEGLEQVSDRNELSEVVKNIISENSKAVEDYKKGKEAALKFLIGKAMRELKGKGNPQVLENIFREELR